MSIRRATKFLSNHPPKSPLLTCHTFSISPRFGRRENIYTISKNGLTALRQILPKDSFPKRPLTSMFELDYQHRTAQISFWILLEIALSGSPFRINWIHHYFEKSGANHRTESGEHLRSKTRLAFSDGTFFIPDSIFLLRDRKTGTPTLFALEVVNGQDVKRTIRQIERHMKAISERTLANWHDMSKGQDYVALFLFLNSGLWNKVQARLRGKSKFSIFQNHFLFVNWEDVEPDIRRCWRKVGNGDIRFQLFTGDPIKK